MVTQLKILNLFLAMGFGSKSKRNSKISTAKLIFSYDEAKLYEDKTVLSKLGSKGNNIIYIILSFVFV